MASVTATMAIGYFRNLTKGPTKLLVRSGLVSSISFKETPSYLAAASNTMRTFPGLLMLMTGWCGRYQADVDTFLASVGVNFLAYP